ncbi:substrate-binding domain-containing protein [Bradyrhizobium sp. HKCCYLS1011]|uniref:substrate-binding domain-containing protein n=1 Tax=Bradyrhizobium sp. HKCCYLS1011 TaxID=3420733 RepID=UPI003EBA4C88
MNMQSTTKYLLGTSSALVLSAAALLSAAQPANAQATNGLYFGGSTLASEAFRQIFDCYTGATVGNDGFTFLTTTAPLSPGKLPFSCTGIDTTVQGMYAGVGSGNGFRGYISNDPAQWYGGTVNAGATIATPFPAAQPPYVDTANSANFGSYPYPRVDVGLSDSPLASTLASLTTAAFSFTPSTNWASGATTSTTQVAVGSSTPASFNVTAWGNPVQLPAFEVPVAIPVNVSNTSTASFTINSQIQSGGTIVAGGAVQLSSAQLCAIFSGLVTDWNSTATIPTLSSTGTVVNQAFDYTNVGNGVATAQAYASASLPISVAFRSDGSGTSFIITNYLKAVCPLIDPTDTFKYKTIFGASNLPSTSFSNLITNIQNARGNGPWTPATTVAGAWVGASGSGGVQAAVGVTTAQAGRIGYVSGDFVKPFAIASNAPYAGSVQNENQRIAGVTTPSSTATALTFIPPTPANVDNAWADSALVAPGAGSTWANWNVYGINFPSTEPAHGGVAVAGLPVLPLTSKVNAYPLSGTTFLAAYSCYGNDTNGTNLLNFLNWYYQTNGTDSNVADILANNSFHQLNSGWLSAVQNVYLVAGSGSTIALASGGSVDGCTGVTGGANP